VASKNKSLIGERYALLLRTLAGTEGRHPGLKVLDGVGSGQGRQHSTQPNSVVL